MMKLKQTFFLTAGSATLALGMAVAPAQAFTSEFVNITDTEFNQLILDGEFSELFVAETRGGNGRTNGSREVGINEPLMPDGNGGFDPALPFPGAEGQLNIINNNTNGMFDFELSYDAITGKVTYTVGGTSVSATADSGGANGIFLRTRAEGRNGGSASFDFSNLLFMDENMSGSLADLGSASAAGERDVDYLQISDVEGSFTLTGKQTIQFTGDYPRESRLAAQIKVGNFSDTESVPEPMTMLGTVVALGAGYSLKRRRDRQEA